MQHHACFFGNDDCCFFFLFYDFMTWKTVPFLWLLFFFNFDLPVSTDRVRQSLQPVDQNTHTHAVWSKVCSLIMALEYFPVVRSATVDRLHYKGQMYGSFQWDGLIAACLSFCFISRLYHHPHEELLSQCVLFTCWFNSTLDRVCLCVCVSSFHPCVSTICLHVYQSECLTLQGVSGSTGCE